MMSKKFSATVGCLVLLGLCLVLWYYLHNRHLHQPPIATAAILPMTGSAATFGKWGSTGLLMAVEDINASGGINGRNVSLVVEDSAGDPTKATTAIRKLLSVDRPEVVFSIVSAVDLALVPIVEKEPVVLISHATHPDITKNRRHVLRHSPVIEQEATLLVDSLTSNDVANGVSILNLNDDYGVGVTGALQQRIRQRFPSALINVVSFGREESNFSGQVSKSLAGNPGLVILATLGKSSGIAIRRLREVAFHGKIITTLGFIVSDAPLVAGEAADGIWCVDLVPPPDNDVTDLRERYRALTGEQQLPMTVLFFYNSVQLWAKARRTVTDGNADRIVSCITHMGAFQGAGESISIQKNGDMTPPLRLIQYHRPN